MTCECHRPLSAVLESLCWSQPPENPQYFSRAGDRDGHANLIVPEHSAQRQLLYPVETRVQLGLWNVRKCYTIKESIDQLKFRYPNNLLFKARCEEFLGSNLKGHFFPLSLYPHRMSKHEQI
ncbi:hypothetical protein CEXT_330861 [Caerostris extrusa]|uniref:Uncharacterized protein n=1 Tax=Caerostris extrusa TaxID=172846 RepID=A0AAV4WTC7_CAEEX|nr:hypothetical protein CEXT_330861 [Caerostris extrusa]